MTTTGSASFGPTVRPLSVRSIAGRRWGRLLPALVLTLASAGSVLAGGQEPAPYHWGVYGAHDLRAPGAACRFVDNELARIRVRPPDVFASRDDSDFRQKVAWRYIIEWSDDVETWQRYYASGLQTSRATATSRADFTARTFEFRTRADEHDAYRVRIRMVWYYGGEVEGRADHWVEQYRFTSRTDDGVRAGGDDHPYCVGRPAVAGP